jgi:hypothetical protein
MVDVLFGAGQAVTSLNAALAVPGATNVFSYGPHNDSNQLALTTWAANNVTWTHRGGGDYTFDGGLGTLDGIRVLGTGNTLNLLNADTTQVKITGYGRYPVKVDGASNTISDLYVYDNGYNAAGNCYDIYLNTASHLIRPVVASGLDNGTRHYGLYLINCSGGSITDAVVRNVTVTGGGTRVYGLVFWTGNGGILVDGLTLDTLSGAQLYSVYSGGAVAADVGCLRRVTISNLSGGTVYGVYGVNKGMDVENFVIDTVVATTSAVGIASQTVGGFPAGSANRIVNGAIYNVQHDGLWCLNSFAGSQMTVRNVIVTDCGSEGFKDSGAIAPDSDYNLAYNNGIDYSGWAIGANDWVTPVNPLFTNPAGNDFTLQSGSPCIDSGDGTVDVRYDIVGLSRPQGTGIDRGAYEYPENKKIIVLGSGLGVGTGTLAANFVLVSNPATKVAATNVEHTTDLLASHQLASGLSASVTAASTTFTETSATFYPQDVGKCLFLYDCDSANWGTCLITAYLSTTQVTTDKTFIADLSTGSIKWAILPPTLVTIFDRYSDFTRTGSHVITVEVPTGIAADDYYIEIVNPNSQAIVFNQQAITLP